MCAAWLFLGLALPVPLAAQATPEWSRPYLQAPEYWELVGRMFGESAAVNDDRSLKVITDPAVIGLASVKARAKPGETLAGQIKWSENSNIGYYAQDHNHEFADDINLFDWMSQWARPGDDEQVIRGILGKMLFSKDDSLKKVKVISGGEKGRMLFGKMMLQKSNIMVMDEPTNHLDMESIEGLNLALENYPGTLIFVSHDREFVSSLATRILEISANDIADFKGDYDEYLHQQGVE